MRHTSSITVILALLCANTAAQNIPDAGALMRQTEQNFRFNQNQRNMPTRAPMPPEAVVSASTSVIVNSFNFTGNFLLSDSQLRAATQSFTNRHLNAHDLQHLTDAVTEEYRKTGWLVQAYIPRQNLAGPELTLQIIESIPPSKPTP